MKRRVLIGIVAGAVGFASLWAQTARPSPQQEFMRQKLEHAKGALEGITTENYDLITQNARKLSAMSQASGWRSFDNPGYARNTEIFRRNVDALIRAAADRNLDGATLAYVKVTMSCVECHKFVRGKETARLDIGAESGRF